MGGTVATVTPRGRPPLPCEPLVSALVCGPSRRVPAAAVWWRGRRGGGRLELVGGHDGRPARPGRHASASGPQGRTPPLPRAALPQGGVVSLDMTTSQRTGLQSRCDLLRSLHRPGDPLLLPNAWDVATARAVVEAGFPVVATTSGGVAGTLGYEDHEGAPSEEMLAAAARIARGVEVPVTVDAEAGYGMEPAELVAALRSAGAAGCNLEDTDHAAGSLRDPDGYADWLRAVRQAASEDGYRLVINARVDAFLGPLLGGAGPGTQAQLVPDALRRANAYLEAGVDCVFPIALWEPDALQGFMRGVRGPVNLVRLPQAPPLAELAALGVARVSWGPFLYREAMARFADELASLQE
jgi:2-methylisocitrate lyase-like PEP mutase family enzyme